MSNSPDNQPKSGPKKQPKKILRHTSERRFFFFCMRHSTGKNFPSEENCPVPVFYKQFNFSYGNLTWGKMDESCH